MQRLYFTPVYDDFLDLIKHPPQHIRAGEITDKFEQLNELEKDAAVYILVCVAMSYFKQKG